MSTQRAEPQAGEGGVALGGPPGTSPGALPQRRFGLPTGNDGRRPDGERLPRPPGRRRPGLAALAVLLIVLGAATAGLLALRMDQRSAVLVARRDIGIGEQITAGDLAVARIASEGIATVPADRAGTIIGKYAATRITAGRLVDLGLVSTSGLLTDETAAVGLSLSPGRFPASGLESGDVVQLVRAVDGSGKVISDQARIGSVVAPNGSVFSGGDNAVTVTAVVPRDEAAAVAAAGAADQVTVVLLSRGEPTASTGPGG
jgi:hypothetical protein